MLRLLFSFILFLVCQNVKSDETINKEIFYKHIYKNKILFKNCDISFNDAQLAFDIISNYKFSTTEINNVQNHFLKNALLLLSLGKNNRITISEKKNIIERLGAKNLMQISQIRKEILSLLFMTKYPVQNLIYEIGFDKFNYQDKIDILYLSNDYAIDEITLRQIIKNLMLNHVLKPNDLSFIMSLYRKFVTEDMLLSQLRQMLYKKNITNLKYLSLFIYTPSATERMSFLVDFYNVINSNKKSKIKIEDYKNLDEYIDLMILDNTRNLDTKYEILAIRKKISLEKDKWLQHRYNLTRELMQMKIKNKQDIAYHVISNVDSEFYEDITDYFSQQWLAGYIAYQNENYSQAVEHFKNSLQFATQASSFAKSYYWLGHAYQKNGSHHDAHNAFKDSADYPFTFYGQMGALEINEDIYKKIHNKILFFENESIKPNINLCKNFIFLAGYLPYILNIKSMQHGYIKTFFEMEKDPIVLASGLKVLELDTNISLYHTASAYAANQNVFLVDSSFPRLEVVKSNLVKAIIKQESALKTKSISDKGATGLMQLMPTTAKEVSKSIGLEYDQYRLLFDETYNLTLGHNYIASLLKQYNNHKILALAAYNAGPKPVNKWIKENGDPRNFQSNIDIVSWIEAIPYKQTREYVIKVLGSDMVYEVIADIELNSTNNN